MRNTRIGGALVLGAVVALSIVALAANAEAFEHAEYGQCVAVAHKSGLYPDKNCNVVIENHKPPKGKYEWEPGPVAAGCVAVKKGFYSDATCETRDEKKGKPKGKYEKTGPGYTSTTEAATLEVQGTGYVVECAASTGAGEVTGTQTGVETDVFTGCQTQGSKCTSEGQQAGTIRTFPMETTLVQPSYQVAWMKYTGEPAHEGYLATYECEGLGTFGATGWVSGVESGGDVEAMSTAGTTTFAVGQGEQDLLTEGPWPGADPSTLVTIAHETAASPIEIRTYVASRP
jgi:hypothetical protein